MNRETMRALVKTKPTVGYEYKTDWPIRQPGESLTVSVKLLTIIGFAENVVVNNSKQEKTNVWSK